MGDITAKKRFASVGLQHDARGKYYSYNCELIEFRCASRKRIMLFVGNPHAHATHYYTYYVFNESASYPLKITTIHSEDAMKWNEAMARLGQWVQLPSRDIMSFLCEVLQAEAHIANGYMKKEQQAREDLQSLSQQLESIQQELLGYRSQAAKLTSGTSGLNANGSELPSIVEIPDLHSDLAEKVDDIYFELTGTKTDRDIKAQVQFCEAMKKVTHGMYVLMRGSYETKLERMLEVLGSEEEISNVSCATDDMFNMYCKTHWRKMFLNLKDRLVDKGLQKKKDQDGMSDLLSDWTTPEKHTSGHCHPSKQASGSRASDRKQQTVSTGVQGQTSGMSQNGGYHGGADSRGGTKASQHKGPHEQHTSGHCHPSKQASGSRASDRKQQTVSTGVQGQTSGMSQNGGYHGGANSRGGTKASQHKGPHEQHTSGHCHPSKQASRSEWTDRKQVVVSPKVGSTPMNEENQGRNKPMRNVALTDHHPRHDREEQDSDGDVVMKEEEEGHIRVHLQYQDGDPKEESAEIPLQSLLDEFLHHFEPGKVKSQDLMDLFGELWKLTIVMFLQQPSMKFLLDGADIRVKHCEEEHEFVDLQIHNGEEAYVILPRIAQAPIGTSRFEESSPGTSNNWCTIKKYRVDRPRTSQ